MSSVIKEIDRRELNTQLKRWYVGRDAYNEMLSAFRYFSNTLYMVDLDFENFTQESIAELHAWLKANVEPTAYVSENSTGFYWFREREIAMQFYLTWGTAFSR